MSKHLTTEARRAQRIERIEALCNTSVDDCRSSIAYITDVEFLCRLESAAISRNHKTRAAIVRRRINAVLDAKRGGK